MALHLCELFFCAASYAMLFHEKMPTTTAEEEEEKPNERVLNRHCKNILDKKKWQKLQQ